MERLEKRHLNMLRNRLKRVQKQLSDKHDMWKEITNVKSFIAIDENGNHIKNANNSRKNVNEKCGSHEALQVIDDAKNGVNGLISSLPHFNDGMRLKDVNHHLPLMFINFDEDIISNDDLFFLSQMANMYGVMPEVLLPYEIITDEDKKMANYLTCYLMLSGFKNIASTTDAEKKLAEIVDKMKTVREKYISELKKDEKGIKRKKGKIRSHLGKLFSNKENDNICEEAQEITEDNYDSIINKCISKMLSGEEITEDDKTQLKKIIFSSEYFTYELVFILYDNPLFKEMVDVITEDEAIFCFECFLASHITDEDRCYRIRKEAINFFKLEFGNYLKIYFKRYNKIFQNASITNVDGGNFKFHLNQNPDAYMRPLSKIRKLMDYYINNQDWFIDINKDTLVSSNPETIDRSYNKIGDNSTYTIPVNANGVTQRNSQKSKVDVRGTRISILTDLLENIFDDSVLEQCIEKLLKSDDYENTIIGLLGIKKPENDEEFLNITEPKFHDALLNLYIYAHQLTDENGSLTFTINRKFINLEVLRDIDENIDMYDLADSTNDIELMEQTIKQLLEDFAELKNELDKIEPEVDNTEHNVIYYTTPAGNDAEDISIIDDIKNLKKECPVGAIQSCLQTFHDAFSNNNADAFLSNSVKVLGADSQINGNTVPIYVKNRKVIFAVAECNVNGKKVPRVIILGAGNGEAIFNHAKDIANSDEFIRFYEKVCKDPNFSQPLDYADQVFKACDKGKSRTNN